MVMEEIRSGCCNASLHLARYDGIPVGVCDKCGKIDTTYRSERETIKTVIMQEELYITFSDKVRKGDLVRIVRSYHITSPYFRHKIIVLTGNLAGKVFCNDSTQIRDLFEKEIIID